MGTRLDHFMYLPYFSVVVTYIIKTLSTAFQISNVHVSFQPSLTSKVSFEVTSPCPSVRLTTGCPQQRLVET